MQRKNPGVPAWCRGDEHVKGGIGVKGKSSGRRPQQEAWFAFERERQLVVEPDEQTSPGDNLGVTVVQH